ncbi:MAG: TSUP family transporter, partial [Chloroflexota bacterium]|nr:TSUP family transporter [Chloroflexota bacterium]
MPIDTTLILVGLIIFIASAIKITFGVGFALIGTPLLLLVMEPNKVVGFIAPLILLQDMIILSQTWRHVPWRHAAMLAAAAVVVAPFSAQLLTVLDPRTLQITISSIIIVVGLALLAGLRLSIRREPVAMVAGGAVSGLVFPLSGISGPPVALLLVNQQWPVQTMRAVLAAYLVVLEIVTITAFAINGVVNVESLVEGVFMLPFLGMSVV